MYRFVLLAAVFLLAGCAGATSADPAIVTMADDQAPTNFDPRIAINASAERIFRLLFVSLVKRNDESQIESDLALSWDIPDSKTYIFHLRKDAVFHDGRPITAKDVVFTFRSILENKVRTVKLGTYRLIESVEAQNPYTVVFKLKEPFAPFLYNLSRGGIGIVPDGAGEEFARHPVGSGPFEFVHYIQDQEVLLKRSSTYFGAKPRISFLRIKIIPEAIITVLELRKGSVDLALNVLTPDMVEVLKKESDLKVEQSEGTNYQYLALNLRDPVFRDIRVRQAFAYAIDRDQIIKFLWRNQARPATGVLPPSNWAHAAGVKAYPHDAARARALLKEAGYENLSFTYRTSNNEDARLMAAVLQQQLRQIGVRMEIRSNEFATFFADIIKGNFQMYSLRWVGGNNDPDILDAIFSSNRTPPNGFNRGFYSNPRVDALIETGRHELDPEKRKAAYHEVQRITAEELPYISLFYRDNICIHNKRIRNVKVNPEAAFDFLTEIEVQ